MENNKAIIETQEGRACNMSTLIVIPARMASERLPYKPLLVAGGSTLIQHVYDRAKSTKADHVVVTSEDDEIENYCKDSGITFVRSYGSGNYPTGTHRCAGVITVVRGYDVIINWQVDEVELDPEVVDRLIDACHRSQLIWTVVADHTEWENDENQVKVRVAESEFAIDFSRKWFPLAKFHVGVYAYPGHILSVLGNMKTTELSRTESLEQLAWLEAVWRIQTISIPWVPLSINTPEDLKQFEKMYA